MENLAMTASRNLLSPGEIDEVMGAAIALIPNPPSD